MRTRGNTEANVKSTALAFADFAKTGGARIAMKDLAAIAIATAVAAGTGLTVSYVRSTDYFCPPPSAVSVATLFVPCAAFAAAIGHGITRKEAVQMGVLTDDEQSTQPATRLSRARY